MAIALPRPVGRPSGRPTGQRNESADRGAASRRGAEPVGWRTERKKAAHALVHETLAQGHHSRRAIARHLGWDLYTVLRYANAAHGQDTIRENRPRPADSTPTSPTSNDGSRRDVPTSPDSTAS